MRVRAVGADALLLEVDEPAAWFAELWRRRATGELTAAEIVPGAATVLLDGVVDLSATTDLLRGLAPPLVDAMDAGDPMEIAVHFAGPDLAEVARLWHTDEDGVVEHILRIEFRVAFCGFAPGWAYLAGLPPELAVPRRRTPRARVPAGSVGLADRYAGIYPTASPGGWQLIGSTDVTLFDADRDPPALLAPGTRVRFAQSAPDPRP